MGSKIKLFLIPSLSSIFKLRESFKAKIKPSVRYKTLC